MKINKLVFSVSLLSTLAYALIYIVWSLQLRFECLQYLDRTSNANTVELASNNLQIAIVYLEQHNLTNGNTGIIFNQPKNDIGYFYANLKASMQELVAVDGASQLEKSNILMKLRETLIEQGGEYTDIACPNGLSRYPYNTLMCVWITLSMLILIPSSLILTCGE